MKGAQSPAIPRHNSPAAPLAMSRTLDTSHCGESICGHQSQKENQLHLGDLEGFGDPPAEASSNNRLVLQAAVWPAEPDSRNSDSSSGLLDRRVQTEVARVLRSAPPK